MATALAAGTSGLLEREGILAELHQAHDKALAGNGRLVLVAGEAGGGKTALLGRFCDDLAGHTTALRGGCDPLLTPRPLGPFLDLGEAGLREARRRRPRGCLGARRRRRGARGRRERRAARARPRGPSSGPARRGRPGRRCGRPLSRARRRARPRPGRRRRRRGRGGSAWRGSRTPCEDPCIRARAERADEAGLADTRLPADEHQAPALAPGVFQEREQLLPLEQLRHVRLHGAPTLTRRVRPHDPGEARGASRLAP